MTSLTRQCLRTLAVAAMIVALAVPAHAQQVVKIGLLATLEGPFAAGGQDGMRGAELAVKQRNGMVAGKKIELVKASSDAKPDVAVNATRKLVEQDKVQIMVGPLSGSEGIAVKDYSKTQPNITFINGSSGAQATTLVNPSENFFRFNTEGGQWMVGLGKADASVIARIPKDVDALVVVLGGADAGNFLNQYEQAGGDKPLIGGSITVDQTVLNYKGKRRESLVGTLSA